MVLEYYDDYDTYCSDYSQQEEDEYEEEYNEEEECESNIVEDNYEYDPLPERCEWRDVKVGDVYFKVSSEGKVMFSRFNVTYGFREAGTPYRFINIEISPSNYRRYYVHDIVWRAFNGNTVPIGWEVRHFDYTPMDSGGCYINCIDYLDVYEKIISRDIQLETFLHYM